MSACFPRAHSDGPPTLLISRRCVDNQWEAGETREGDTKGRKMDSGPKGGGYELQNGRLCRIQSWRHRAKTLCDRVAGSAPEERGGGGGGAQVGAEEISFGRTESETTPAFYAQDAALGWRLCHLGLEGTFSHKRANKRNVSPPRMHSSESECGRHFLWEGGLQLEEFSGQRLYTPSTRAVKLRRALVYFSQEGPGR